MKNLKLNLKGLYGYRQSLLSRSPQPRDNREMSERRPSEERTLLAPLPQRFARYAVMLLMLLTLGVGQMRADEYTAVVGVACNNTSNYTVKLNVNRKGDGSDWEQKSMSKAGITFEGKKLYITSYTNKYGGLGKMQFQYYNGDTYKEQKEPISSWSTSTHDEEIYNYDGSSWYSTQTVETSARFYFDASGWEQTSIKLVVGHANYQRYSSLTNVTNTKLYYGSSGNKWTNAMGIGVVGNTSASDGTNWLTNVSSKASEYTGFKNYGLTATSSGNAYLMVNNGKAGEQPTMHYNASHTTLLNSTQTIKYAVGINGGTPATLTSGYVPADIAISSYEFSSGTYNSVSSSSGSVTLSQGGSNYSATVTAARTATTTYTVSNVHEDYSFLGWYSAASGGTLLSSELSYTFYPTSATTAYARFSKENNHSVTISRYCTSTSTEINNTSAKVGEVTYSSIEAPDIHGYSFVNWTVGSGLTKHASDAVTSNPIRVITAASGDYTLTANYTEVLTTDWKLIGDNTTNSPFGDNYSYALGKAMSKKSGASATDKAYKTLDITHTGTWGFKVATASGNSYTYGWGTSDGSYITFNRSKSGNQQDVYTGEQHQLKFNPDGLGEYEFEIDYTAAKCSVKVTFPMAYTVTYGKGTGGNTVSASYSSTSFDSGTKVQSGKTVRFTQTASSGYQFKEWNSNSSGTGTQLSTSTTYDRTVASSNTVYAIYDPKQYTITLNDQDATTNVDPLTVKATYKSLTLSSSITNPEKDGYTFGGWYSATGGGGYEIINTSGALQASKSGYTDATGWTKTSAAELYAKWTQVLTLDKNGGTTDGGLTVVYKKTATSAHTAATRTGYTLNGYYDATSGGNKIINADGTLVSYSGAVLDYISSSGAWIYNGTPTLYAQWTAKSYDVTLKPNGATTGSDQVVRATFDASMPTSTKTSVALVAPAKTGYTLQGFYQNSDGTGTKYYNANMTSANNWDQDGSVNIYAKWTANPYTVVLDKQTSAEGYGGNAGTVANQTVTFDATPATVSGTMPSAANGYAFMGFYSAEDGEGRQFINPSGEWVANAGDTISGGNWVKPDGITLYAYYKQAEITGITFTDGAVVPPSTSKTVTAVISPTPTGTTTVCWRVLYSNDNPMDPQPSFSSVSGNSVSFTAPAASGMYKMEAVLHLGSGCSGDELSTYVANFQVAGDHTVTVQYKCGDETIAPSTTVTGRPLVWSEVVAHDIFGYTFSGWTAGDGITIRDTTATRLEALQAEDETIVAVTQMKAIYDGRLTANYTKKDFIYFKNTLGWSGDGIHVYFYTSSGYWSDTKGAGATGPNCIGKGKMNLVPGETDIYYWDYGAGVTEGAAAATKHVAFTNKNKMDQDNFWDCEVVYPTKGNNEGFSTGTPMFVPISQTKVTYNEKADYYNKGYWTKYAGGTGYSVDIFFSKGGSYDKSIWFEEGETAGMPFTATAYLSGGTTLGFKIHRSSGLYYYSSTDVTMSNASTAKSLTYDNTSEKQTGITTNVTGEYTFTLTCGSDGRLNVTVKYPAAAGDYRLVYSDGVQTKPLVSDVVPQVNGGKDTVSFFVRPENAPVLKIQQASVSAGVLSWSDYSNISSSVSGLAATGVYNICLTMNESGAISVENVEAYTGEFYIRTDAANNKWDNYRAPDHLMTYSEYSETYSDYTHYFMAYVGNGTNVKFVVANDYSPCISDTLVQSTFRDGDSYHVNASGNILADANVRFMWNRSNNAVYRAYLAKAQSDGTKFLVLRANSSTDLMDENGNPLTGVSEGTPGNNHGGGLNCMQFTDNQNWIYEANVKVKPGAFVKLYAYFHGKNFYYRGNDNDNFDDTKVDGVPNAINLITGSGDAVKVRVVYDFKTDRLLAAWMPEGEIDDSKAINADVMFVREGQGDIAQLTFTESGEITAIKTAYGVMKFNKWTLNNKDKDTHTVLSSPASIYERSLFWISFPFRVKLNEVFGFGTYGVDWAIQRYDGAERAEKGFWLESSGFWKWMDRNTEYLEPNQGYLLAIDLDLLGESASVWDNGVENVELYFPSYGTMPSITSAAVEQTLTSHLCEIDRSGESNGHGGTLGSAYNRTVIDSHWNVMSVPTYVNTASINFANTDWITAGDGKRGPNFLYTWNPDDNTLTATAGEGYTYHAMHAYMVQYCGNVTWTASSGSPYSPIVARRTYAEQPKKVNFCLEIQQNEKMIDRTFVQLSDDEEVSAEFSFGEDMGKEFNSRKANIYTVIENYLPAAGNTLPMSDQTTLVPVGVKTTAAGEYTFAMPEGTSGVSVVLIDNIAGTRTNLALSDYTVALGKGDLSDRFMLEIAPIKQMPTDIENVQGDNVQGTKVRKVMVDGILYIVKDGKVFDARGAKVK